MIIFERNFPGKFQTLTSGTRFVIGNGHLGYRGTLEECDETSMPCLSMVGFYDQFQDLWREPVSYPDPFFFNAKSSARTVTYTKTKQRILLDKGIYQRESSGFFGTLKTERFCSYRKEKIIAEKVTFIADKPSVYVFEFGFRKVISSLHGNHFKNEKYYYKDGLICFEGKTNEGHIAKEFLKIKTNVEILEADEKTFTAKIKLSSGERISFEFVSYVYSSFLDGELDESEMKSILSLSYDDLKKEHTSAFSFSFDKSRIIIEGDKRLQLGLDYCNYLLVSSRSNYITSIPARGFSGQTYKGAIFWDSEVFLLPFYLIYDKEEAKNLIQYRINGLKGAKEKAKRFGTDGAFYAWESQEDGKEACTMYSVTDVKTGKGIRTYFVDKQIHISADVALALRDFEKVYPDKDLLLNGGLEMLFEIVKFYLSYSVKDKDGLYHLNDVIGPDEYHERIDDNAFTNYRVKETVSYFHSLMNLLSEVKLESLCFYKEYKEKESIISDFEKKLYIPIPNKDGIIEQFKGYFELEDCSVKEVASRLVDKNQYWGGEKGPASSTRVIKQADVIALLALDKSLCSPKDRKENYYFYEKYTEHGSSLSSSMYSLLAYEINDIEKGYEYLCKSAMADINGVNKEYAGSIYIGGSHMASAGGAYLTFIYGMLGYDGRDVHPRLSSKIKSVTINLLVDGKLQKFVIKNGRKEK